MLFNLIKKYQHSFSFWWVKHFQQNEPKNTVMIIQFKHLFKADYRWLTHNFIMCTIIPIFYGVIYVCFIRIRRAIEEMNVLKVREYNKQVSRALLFQVGETKFIMNLLWTIRNIGKWPILIPRKKNIYFLIKKYF